MPPLPPSPLIRHWLKKKVIYIYIVRTWSFSGEIFFIFYMYDKETPRGMRLFRRRRRPLIASAAADVYNIPSTTQLPPYVRRRHQARAVTFVQPSAHTVQLYDDDYYDNTKTKTNIILYERTPAVYCVIRAFLWQITVYSW